MTGQDMPPQAAARLHRPAHGAAPFGIEEIFFSRTDERGVIRAFNDVFLRIADYTAADLIGAPHRIIRHPDMPKGVFHLLWEGIKAGHPIGAYVKNRARDGLFYWVYALITPIAGGYLSVRIKPSADLLRVVEAEYAALLKAEASGLSPAASADILCARLAALGFPTHGAFQTDALLQEMQARNNALGQAPDRDLAALRRMGLAMTDIRAEIAGLARLLAGARLLTANMRIVAAKLNEGRRTIGEIARSYAMVLDEMHSHVAGFSLLPAPSSGGAGDGAPPSPAANPPATHASGPEERGLFLLCAARLMDQVCADFFSQGAVLDGVDHAAEAAILRQVAARYAAEAGPAMQAVGAQVRHLRRDVEYLRRLVIGLSTVRIACRVESGLLRHGSANLDTIIGRIDDLQDGIIAALDRIDRGCMAATSAFCDWQALRGGATGVLAA